jgi:hypothetical protein
MDKQMFFTTPVEAVRVTTANLEEVAKWCGGRVFKSERKDNPGVYDSYIWVPTPKGKNYNTAYPGSYVTRRVTINSSGVAKEQWAVFRRDYFDQNYFVNPQEATSKVLCASVSAFDARNEFRST